MEVGIDSFVAHNMEGASPPEQPASDVMRDYLVRIEYADQLGIEVFGVGEYHRREYLDSAPTAILGAAAARTKAIRSTSAVTVLFADDPVRVFEKFATPRSHFSRTRGEGGGPRFVHRGFPPFWASP